jgi:hypothetical protein
MWPALNQKRALHATVILLAWMLILVVVLLWKQLEFRVDFCKRPYETVCSSGVHALKADARLKAYRLWEELKTAHPDSEDEELRDLFVERVFSTRKMEEISKAFEWVRDHLRDWVLDAPESTIPKKDKESLVYRINQIRIEDPTVEDSYVNDAYLLFSDEIQYVRYDNGFLKIRFGGAYILGEPGRSNLVFSLAHEMAHAIDPCELVRTGAHVSAFKPVESCFREKRWYNTSLGDGCGERPHLAELFADWIGARILARSLKDVAPERRTEALQSAVADLCYAVGKSHPAPEVRIGRILGESPEVRGELGCSGPASDYCVLPDTPRP